MTSRWHASNLQDALKYYLTLILGSSNLKSILKEVLYHILSVGGGGMLTASVPRHS